MFIPQSGQAAHMNKQCTLMEAPLGSTVRVSTLAGDKGMRSHLMAMGITPGCEITVCPHCSCANSRKVMFRNCSLVLNETIAKTIFCNPLCDKWEQKINSSAGKMCCLKKIH